MILGGRALQEAFAKGKWKAWTNGSEPFIPVCGPNSIDVRIGPFFYCLDFQGRWLELMAPLDGSLQIAPGDFLLGCTMERFDSSAPLQIDGQKRHFAQMLEGRSTLARMGIQIHLSAGYGDYGFCGAFTLEIVNHSPIHQVLPIGARVGQITFVEVWKPRVYGEMSNQTSAYAGASHYARPVLPQILKRG